MKTNIFDLPAKLPADKEVFHALVEKGAMKLERIISTGQCSECWYDQPNDEFVIVIEGEAELIFDDGTVTKMRKGDYLHIPANQKHKVAKTSTSPPCIWLALHY